MSDKNNINSSNVLSSDHQMIVNTIKIKALSQYLVKAIRSSHEFIFTVYMKWLRTCFESLILISRSAKKKKKFRYIINVCMSAFSFEKVVLRFWEDFYSIISIRFHKLNKCFIKMYSFLNQN